MIMLRADAVAVYVAVLLQKLARTSRLAQSSRRWEAAVLRFRAWTKRSVLYDSKRLSMAARRWPPDMDQCSIQASAIAERHVYIATSRCSENTWAGAATVSRSMCTISPYGLSRRQETGWDFFGHRSWQDCTVASQRDGATQTLILVHRRELVEQAARHCANRYPSLTVDIEMGNLYATGVADITIASVQSINSRARIEKFDPLRYKLILVDEAHHIVAAGYLSVLEHFGLQEESISPEAPALVGVSATLSRFDGLALGKAIKDIVFHMDYVDMIGEKFLSDVIFTTVRSHADLSQIKSKGDGDFQSSALSAAVNTPENNVVTVRAWLDRTASGTLRHSTIVFCVDLAHVEALTTTFRQHGIDARFVTGDTPKKVRSDRLDAFRNREYPVLLNCGVFTEGTDIPNIDCVLLARPTRSRNLLVQMIGRGMRLYPGKKDCHVIDMVSSLESGIVTTPTLFGLDPSELVNDADHETLEALRKRKEEAKRREAQAKVQDAEKLPKRDAVATTQQLNRVITFTSFDSVADLIDDTTGERFVRRLSHNAWVHVGDDRYNPRQWRTRRIPDHRAPAAPQKFKAKSPYWRTQTIATCADFESAVHAADTFAGKRFTHALIALSTQSASWRKGPASQAQVDFLNRFRDEDEKLVVGEVTKGKASDMITKVKFGAKGWWEKMKKEDKQEAKVKAKEDAFSGMRDRERVRVGPVAA
ncbi:hypothetical protein MRB53_040358 [Persea americana]|nr:hypothetical protein MRB53_040358 [Persea americana]